MPRSTRKPGVVIGDQFESDDRLAQSSAGIAFGRSICTSMSSTARPNYLDIKAQHAIKQWRFSVLPLAAPLWLALLSDQPHLDQPEPRQRLKDTALKREAAKSAGPFSRASSGTVRMGAISAGVFQSCAATERHQSTMPMWFCGHCSTGSRSK